MTGELRVRRATGADAAAVAGVYRRAWRSAFGAVLGPDRVPDAALEGRGLESVRAPLCLVAVRAGANTAPGGGACMPGAVLGFVSGDPAAGLLDRLYVDPAAQGCGAGAALLTAAETALRSGGVRPWLWVWEQNTAARGFYRRLGWVSTGDEKVIGVAGMVFRYQRWAAPPG